MATSDDSIAALAARASNGRLTLGDLKRAPVATETVAEWDVTPGLHEWIEEEIDRRAEVAANHQQPCGSWEHDSFVHEIRDVDNGGTVAYVPREGTGRFIEVNDPDDVLHCCAADRKILAAHPYTERVVSPSYGSHSAGFGCETCHARDGAPEGRGNCATILALAERYGLEPAGEADVEVIRG